MRIIKPDYYDKFICIADRCPYTCCQQWDIHVDDETQEKWETMKVPTQCTASIRSLRACVKKDLISFNRERQCKLMTEQGLCSMVLAYGEESIPQTCHVFPRETHVYGDRTEYALSPECPEALRLLWEGETFSLISEETKEEKNAALHLRDRLLEILRDPTFMSTDTSLLLIACLVALQDDRVTDAHVREILDVLSAAAPSDPGACVAGLRERNELLMDSLYEYQDQGRYLAFLDPIMEMAESWQAALEADAADAVDQARGWAVSAAAWEPALRRLFTEEVYASLLPQDPDPEDADSREEIRYHMILKLEWLVMACSNIRQCLMLRWINGATCDIKELSEIVVVIMRIMGFADDDIIEYMEDEFEEAIWPIEYALLLR